MMEEFTRKNLLSVGRSSSAPNIVKSRDAQTNKSKMISVTSHNFSKAITDIIEQFNELKEENNCDKRRLKEKFLKDSLELIYQELSNTLSTPNGLDGLINTLMFVSGSLGFREEPLLFQWTCIKSMATQPLNPSLAAALSLNEIEKSINELRHYLSSEDELVRSFACALLAYLTKYLPADGKHYTPQISIICKNLFATLRSSIAASGSSRSSISDFKKDGSWEDASSDKWICLPICVASVSVILQHSIIELAAIAPNTKAQSNKDTSFIPYCIKELCAVVLMSAKQYIPAGSDPQPILLLRWSAAECLLELGKCDKLWGIIEPTTRNELLKVALDAIKLYLGTDSEPLKDVRSDTLDGRTLTMLLGMLDATEAFEAVLCLPNYVCQLVSKLADLLLPIETNEEEPADLALRWAALKILGRFLASGDCQQKMEQSIDWEGLFLGACRSRQQLLTLHKLLIFAYQSYVETNRITNHKSLQLPLL